DMLRQLYFAFTDLELHHRWRPDGPESPFDVQRHVAERTTVLPPLPEDRFLCSFSHIFAGGYAAGYYSYKWAEVLSADAFSAFEEAGLEDPRAVAATGRRFRDTVLALGGSRHPMEVFKAFRGREPSTAALLRQAGLPRAAGAASADRAARAVERQVLHRQQPGLRRAHRRDRVQDAHRGGDETAIVVVAPGAAELQVADHRRHALDDDAVAAGPGRLRPLGRDLGTQARHVLEHDRGPAAHHALDLEAQPGHRARGHRSRGHGERRRGGAFLVGLADVLDLDAEGRGDAVQHGPPRQREHARHEEQRRVLHGIGEAHGV